MLGASQGGQDTKGMIAMRSVAPLAAMVATLGLALAASAQAQTVTASISPDFAKDAAKLGNNEVERQLADLTRRVERALSEQGALEGAQVELVVTDLKPNRPTMQQVTEKPGLDMMRSLSIGGATIEGTVTLGDGTVQPVSARYYTPDIADAYGVSTWHDANRAFSRLASNLADGRYITR